MNSDITKQYDWISIKDGVVYEFQNWIDTVEFGGKYNMTKSYYINHWLPDHETK